MDLKTPNFIKQGLHAAMLYFIGVAIVCLITPHTAMLAKYKLPISDIYLMPGEIQIVPNRFAANPTNRKASSQFNPRDSGSKRLHFRFDEHWPVATARTLYIPSASGETRVFINGAPIPVSQPLEVFAPGLGSQWVAHDISRQILVPGSNRLDIHLQDDAVRAGIREIYFAPSEKAARIIRQQRHWIERLPRAAAIGAGLLTLFSFGGIVFGRDKLGYLFMGCVGAVLLGQASLTFAGEMIRARFGSADYALRIFIPVCLLSLTLCLWRRDIVKWPVNTQGRKAFQMGVYLLTLTGPVLALASMTLPIVIPAPLQITTFALAGPLVYLLPKSGLNLQRDLAARRSRLAQLSAKVSEQAEALDEKSQVIAQEMQKRAVLEERQRFTRDIHDGIGGQLLSLLLRVRTGKVQKEHIAEELQQGLNDLRLVVDSMDHTGDDLQAALTTFRMRAENQMRAANIVFSWQQSEQLSAQFPESRGTLTLYRFMQEVLTNIVRHAKADHVSVKIEQSKARGALLIDITDDGIGLSPQAITNPGKGLKNLQERAKFLDAELDFLVGPDGRGTTVKLVIPPQN